MDVGQSLLSQASRTKLDQINQQLALVVYMAAESCPLALTVVEGLRTERRQAELVRTGASRTMYSRHITGNAVDLAPVVDGEVRWDWPLFFTIAASIRAAAIKLCVPIRWGGVWDTPLSSLPETSDAIHDAQIEYVSRVKERGGRPFLDGPHFEIPVNAPISV